MKIANIDVREKIRISRVKNYEVADKIGMSNTYFSAKLRKELSAEEKEKIYKAIEEIKNEG